MTLDYVQPVAKAYGDGSPELRSIAKRQQEEIEAEIGRLRNQAYTIRQLVGLAPPPPPPPVVVEAEDTAQAADAATVEVVAEPNGQQMQPWLTEEQKKLARELWDAERQSGHDLTSQQVVDLMRGRGIVFGVQQPAAAIGMTLAAARRGWKNTHRDEVSQ
ncbi:MAG TPA: hypothetical protein VND96_20175 [Candidatus Micrarchaeaceae archaeon]|nr:hypothetical protein [Candidatus Micrarchaeaceae archaeon]